MDASPSPSPATTDRTDRTPPYYARVDLERDVSFASCEKEGGMYVVRLDPPLLVQTPVVEVASDLDQDEAFAYLEPRGAFLQFVRDVEAFIVSEAIRHKAEWLPRLPHVDDEDLSRRFRSFVAESEAGGPRRLKTRVLPASFVAYDEAGVECEGVVRAGSTVRAVMELSRVCFGRSEFGALWRLLQTRAASPAPPCLIDVSREMEDDDEEDAPIIDDDILF